MSFIAYFIAIVIIVLITCLSCSNFIIVVFDHLVSADLLFVLSFWLNTCQINSHSNSLNLLSLLLLLESLPFVIDFGI